MYGSIDMKLTTGNVNIAEDGKYYRVYITAQQMPTHHFHSEKLNLDTAMMLRDDLVREEE